MWCHIHRDSRDRRGDRKRPARYKALCFKNEPVLKKADASNQWTYYQARGTKRNLTEIAEELSNDADNKANCGRNGPLRG
jgi:hypothetical protein